MTHRQAEVSLLPTGRAMTDYGVCGHAIKRDPDSPSEWRHASKAHFPHWALASKDGKVMVESVRSARMSVSHPSHTLQLK